MWIDLSSQSVAAEISLPGSDLQFYKLTYRGELYIPIVNDWVVHLRTELGYGDGYGNTTGLPFYENFYSGGFGSVRGFESHTLGPRATEAILYDAGRPTTKVDENGNPGPSDNPFKTANGVDGRAALDIPTTGAPITFEFNNKQYIAVVSTGGRYHNYTKKYGELYVFSLKSN